jgi:hypothetical protein
MGSPPLGFLPYGLSTAATPIQHTGTFLARRGERDRQNPDLLQKTLIISTGLLFSMASMSLSKTEMFAIH